MLAELFMLWVLSSLKWPWKGSAQIGVEIQHKDPLLADPGAIRANVVQQGGVERTVCVTCLACQ